MKLDSDFIEALIFQNFSEFLNPLERENTFLISFQFSLDAL